MFIVNKTLSMCRDTAIYANEMNKCKDLPKYMQYDFYIHAIRKGYKKFSWKKKAKITNLEMIMEYYNYSERKAEEALRILSADDIKEIKMELHKGGNK